MLICRAKIHQTRLKLGKGISTHQPLHATGRGKISIGDKCQFGVKLGGHYRNTDCEIQARYINSVVKLGKNVASNNGLLIISAENIEIGDDCLLGVKLSIIDHDAHGIHPRHRRKNIGTPKPVLIGKNVWIGNNVTVLKGTQIGDNCVVGACSVLTGKTFPANTIIAGNPAKVVREISDDDDTL